MSKERELLEEFFKKSGIHHVVSESTYNNFVERFLAGRPEEKEEKTCLSCEHQYKSITKEPCHSCSEFDLFNPKNNMI